MGKLCAKGKAAAKRKFKVYPSAYANMYASSICSGKTVEGGKKKKKANGGMINKEQKKISKMRPTCKSHTDDKVAKGECCQQKESCG